MHVLQEQKQAQLRAFWAVTLETLIFTARAPHRETSGVLPFALRASLRLFNFVPDKLSMAGPLSHLTARDGRNVGLAGALTDPADKPDISAVSAAAPEAQKTITALPRFRSNVFFSRSYALRGNATVPARATTQSVGARCVANTLSFEIRLSGLLKPAIVRRQTTR
ncbi:hypothetical protein [Thalassolituus hydrocarboniclasticus]|nr:hypothetical protein [Thalassolituus hydrocarboniclasticus]